jgi:hypothetical protein
LTFEKVEVGIVRTNIFYVVDERSDHDVNYFSTAGNYAGRTVLQNYEKLYLRQAGCCYSGPIGVQPFAAGALG